MDWTILVMGVLVFSALVVAKRMTFVRASIARKLLREGAVVVDVRSKAEFRTGHLPEALNLPLDGLGEEMPRHFPDKNQTVLLHCLSGTRSGMARRQLKALGYPNVFNLGSYGRARRVIGKS